MKNLIIALTAFISITASANSFTVSCTSNANPDNELVLFINNASLVQIRVQSNGLPKVLPFTKISVTETETRFNVSGFGIIFLENKVLNDQGGRLNTSSDSFYCM